MFIASLLQPCATPDLDKFLVVATPLMDVVLPEPTRMSIGTISIAPIGQSPVISRFDRKDCRDLGRVSYQQFTSFDLNLT